MVNESEITKRYLTSLIHLTQVVKRLDNLFGYTNEYFPNINKIIKDTQYTEHKLLDRPHCFLNDNNLIDGKKMEKDNKIIKDFLINHIARKENTYRVIHNKFLDIENLQSKLIDDTDGFVSDLLTILEKISSRKQEIYSEPSKSDSDRKTTLCLGTYGIGLMYPYSKVARCITERGFLINIMKMHGELIANSATNSGIRNTLLEFLPLLQRLDFLNTTPKSLYGDDDVSATTLVYATKDMNVKKNFFFYNKSTEEIVSGKLNSVGYKIADSDFRLVLKSKDNIFPSDYYSKNEEGKVYTTQLETWDSFIVMEQFLPEINILMDEIKTRLNTAIKNNEMIYPQMKEKYTKYLTILKMKGEN